MSEITIPALPADLPEDFKMQDIIAPNGADVGKSPQHGYNYLMQQMNETQRAVVALARESNSAYENKANLTSVVKATGENPTDYTLNQVARVIIDNPLFPDIYGQYVCLRSTQDRYGGSYGLHIFATSAKFWWQLTSDISPITLNGWVPIATAEPPQEYTLSIAQGITGLSNEYYKTQEGLVVGYLTCVTPSSTSGDMVFATFPKGDRPMDTLVCAQKGASYVVIEPNGNMRGHCGAAANILISFTFVAAKEL